MRRSPHQRARKDGESRVGVKSLGFCIYPSSEETRGWCTGTTEMSLGWCAGADMRRRGRNAARTTTSAATRQFLIGQHQSDGARPLHFVQVLSDGATGQDHGRQRLSCSATREVYAAMCIRNIPGGISRRYIPSRDIPPGIYTVYIPGGMCRIRAW